MKKSAKRLVSLMLTAAFLGTMVGCGVPAKQTNEELLYDAFVYTLPLVVFDATMKKSTNTVTVTDQQAPVNQLFHAKNLATAEFKDVVTPNVDTVYSQCFFDLSEDGLILELPKTERFCVVEVMDAFTNAISMIDTASFEKDTERFLFVKSDFSGQTPDGIKKIECPTAKGWILIRTICNDAEDIVNVRAIQEKMDSYTLMQYVSGNTEEKPEGVYDPNNNFIPVQYVQGLSMQAYFDKANQLLKDNPPTKDDEKTVKSIARINVGPSLTFDSAIFGDGAETLWKELMGSVAKKCLQSSQAYMMKNGCWSYYGAPIAEFSTAYAYRALISLVGLGANPVSVAVYPKAEYDSDGVRLSGDQQYVLHFEKDELPPVQENGFWSVTAYDSSNNFLMDNAIDRYCINDRSEVVYNEDGSLDIYIQSEPPADELRGNWLPVSAEQFHLILRIYLPEGSVVANEWPTPSIAKK